jgi:FtsH-binding integral membrane protein
LSPPTIYVRYVACGLAVTGLAAYVITYSGFHATMMDQTPPFLLPFVWILLLAPLAPVMLLWFGIDEMGFFAAQATVWACAVLTGFTFECISLVYTGASLVLLSFIAAGTFSAMSVYGYVTGTDLSNSRHFFGMGTVGVVLASIVNFLLASTAAEFALSILGVIALVGLTAWVRSTSRRYTLSGTAAKVRARRRLWARLPSISTQILSFGSCGSRTSVRVNAKNRQPRFRRTTRRRLGSIL